MSALSSLLLFDELMELIRNAIQINICLNFKHSIKEQH